GTIPEETPWAAMVGTISTPAASRARIAPPISACVPRRRRSTSSSNSSVSLRKCCRSAGWSTKVLDSSWIWPSAIRIPLPLRHPPRRRLDPLQRPIQVCLRVLARDAVVPGEVEVHPFLHRGAEEAPGQVAVPAGRLAVAARLLVQPEEQAEARPARLHPDRQPSHLEGVAQAGVEALAGREQRRVEVRL